jgi:hypothetical protein
MLVSIRCRGNVFSKQFPGNDRGYKYSHALRIKKIRCLSPRVNYSYTDLATATCR